MSNANAVRALIGDNWFTRNRSSLVGKDLKGDAIAHILETVKCEPKSILEIGCANGWRLKLLQEKYNCQAGGLDVSPMAIESGLSELGLCGKIDLRVGAQEDPWPWNDQTFDVVVFGYSLCMGDSTKLFYIAAEADRVLKDGGVVVIQDSCSPRPVLSEHIRLKKTDSDETVPFYFMKYDYPKLWLGHPGYRVIIENISPGTMSKNAPLGSVFICTTLLLKHMQFLAIVPPPSEVMG